MNFMALRRNFQSTFAENEEIIFVVVMHLVAEKSKVSSDENEESVFVGNREVSWDSKRF